MVSFSVFIFLIGFESSKVFADCFTTYCALPCPFMGPPQLPSSCGAIQLPPRRPYLTRASFDNYQEYDESPDEGQMPYVDGRQKTFPDSSTTPKPKTKSTTPPPAEEPEATPKKKTPSATPASNPSIQPTRRFFTSLFSIPGAVVDTLIGGEVVL